MMKVLVDEFPKTKGECLFKRICPVFEFCNNTEECSFMRISEPKKIKEETLEEKVQQVLLNELGVGIELAGFKYIVDIITYIDENNLNQYDPFMQIYEGVAELNNRSWESVERCVRHVIIKVLDIGNWDAIEKIFGAQYKIDCAKLPTKRFVFGIYKYAKNN